MSRVYSSLRSIVGTVVLAILLSACSDGDAGNDAESSSGTTDDQSTAAPEASEWDPQEWEPTVEIAPPSMSDAERMALRDERLERLRPENMTDPPEVDLVRWTEGHADHGEAIAACLNEAGFPAIAAPRGIAFEPGVPDSQTEALNLASHVCRSKYSLDPIYTQEWTSDQVGLIYDYWEQYFIPCMADHGHTISTAEKPSRDAYVSAFHTPDRISWWPNRAFSTLDRDEQTDLIDECPPYPPDDIFYGSRE